MPAPDKNWIAVTREMGPHGGTSMTWCPGSLPTAVESDSSPTGGRTRRPAGRQVGRHAGQSPTRSKRCSVTS